MSAPADASHLINSKLVGNDTPVAGEPSGTLTFTYPDLQGFI